jgi:peptidoglycan/LPS O-acetylase OafA/YrhL
MKRISSLDGLRAISILMVVLLHTVQHIGVSHQLGVFRLLESSGTIGVYIFFVISGFLITTLLLREHARYGTISLRDFYLRRAFRILPPVYFYVAVMIVISWKWKLGISIGNVCSALFFYSNYVLRPWTIGHFWTLSVEEQFYFVWPLVLLFVLRRHGRAAAAWVAVAVIFICPMIRIASYQFGNQYVRYINGRSFQGCADMIMFGCLLALCSGSEPFERIYGYLARLWWIFPIILIGLLGPLDVIYGNHWLLPFGYTLDGICIAVCVLWCVRNPESLTGKFLNWRPVKYVGVLSYSIYIWQQLFLNVDNVELFGAHFDLKYIPVFFVAMAVASVFSYHVIEKPALRLRDTVEKKLKLAHASAERVVVVE